MFASVFYSVVAFILNHSFEIWFGMMQNKKSQSVFKIWQD
jgi:hypothetical protein